MLRLSPLSASPVPLILLFRSAVTIRLNERANVEMQKEQRAVSGKPLKEKTTKAERRAMQEAQRAAKVAYKGEGSKTSIAAGVNAANANTGKPVKAVSQRKDSFSVAASEKKRW
ncbi:hypothetical protein Pfo_005588 [Paulownia fortunei]|nr:hypothetical protein Pfo_005588 [Paulownia fortunei]